MNTIPSHDDQIIDQFTRQAAPFANRPEHSDAGIFQRLIRFSAIKSTDTLLDVACGPGLLACAFAPHLRTVTGIDMTPAMIDKARELQQRHHLTNLTWDLGSATALPYPDNHFSVVTTRYSFHHFLDPRAALDEMIRVCQPGGTVIVIDVAPPPEKAAAYDRFEKLRDPSHTRALTRIELPKLAHQAGLAEMREEFYRLEVPLESLLSASFPHPDDVPTLREWIRNDINVDKLGFEAQERDGAFVLSFPTLAVAGRKAWK